MLQLSTGTGTATLPQSTQKGESIKLWHAVDATQSAVGQPLVMSSSATLGS